MDDGPSEGIASITSIVTTTKKETSTEERQRKEQRNEKERSHLILHFIAVKKARHPIKLFPPRQTNVFPDSVLGPPQHKTHRFDATPKRNQRSNLIPPVQEETLLPMKTNPPSRSPKTNLTPNPNIIPCMRSSILTKRIKFEVLPDSVSEVDLHAKQGVAHTIETFISTWELTHPNSFSDCI